MGPDARATAALAALAPALRVLRAIAAAFESSLVATGQPRARELGSRTAARPSARALASLFDDPEATAFTGRAIATFSTVLAGFLSGYVGAVLTPGARWAGGLLAAVA